MMRNIFYQDTLVPVSITQFYFKFYLLNKLLKIFNIIMLEIHFEKLLLMML